jgi:hypothetical protein
MPPQRDRMIGSDFSFSPKLSSKAAFTLQGMPKAGHNNPADVSQGA